MPINADYKFMNAEGRYLSAKTDEEKLDALEEMMRTMPTHKSAEALRKNIRTRYKKLKQKMEVEEKKKKAASKRLGIKKGEMQAVFVGLTNANPEVAGYDFTTKQPVLGTLDYQGVKIQLIDLPAIDNELCDQGVINTADTLLLVVENTEDIQKLVPFLGKASKTWIVVFNKIDLLSVDEKRKVEARLRSKKFDFVLVSCKTGENVEVLKEVLFQSFGKIRVYTKEPGKGVDFNDPMVLPVNSSVKDAAEKILHGLSSEIKQTRVTGPSSKFPNQKVGLGHVLRDKDIVEFYVK